MLMIFKETPMFTKEAKRLKVTAKNFATLKSDLLKDPLAGDLIPNGNGLRKIRMPLGNQGKRGGARVIYYNVIKDMILLIFIYAKSEQANLTHSQLEKLKGIL